MHSRTSRIYVSREKKCTDSLIVRRGHPQLRSGNLLVLIPFRVQMKFMADRNVLFSPCCLARTENLWILTWRREGEREGAGRGSSSSPQKRKSFEIRSSVSSVHFLKLVHFGRRGVIKGSLR